MRTSTLRRDDAVLPFTAFFSFLAHSVLLFLIAFPSQAAMNPTEHIIPSDSVTYAVFEEAQSFIVFSKDKRIYSDQREGMAEPSSGDVLVPRLSPSQQPLPPHGATDPEAREANQDRFIYGRNEAGNVDQDQPGGANNDRTGAYRGAATLPEGPDGLVQDYRPGTTRDVTGSVNEHEIRGGQTDQLRSGGAAPSRAAAGTAPSLSQRGLLTRPDPARIPVSTPHSGQTLDHRPVAPAVSAGDIVVPDMPAPRPPAAPPEPRNTRYAGRKLLVNPLPVYPDWAERDNVQATVTYDLTISAEGRVSSVRLAVSSGYPELDRSAEKTVRTWLYEPRTGQTEERRVVVRFRLKNRGEL